MKSKNEKNKRNNNVEFANEFDCCSRKANVEFASEFNKGNNKNKNHKARKTSADTVRTNAYAGMTEYANELGTARNATDTIGNDPITDNFVDDFRNVTSQSAPYPYAKYEIANEPYYAENNNSMRDFSKLENARKSYFEKLQSDRKQQQKNKKNS